MATNTGDNHRVGAISNRSQARNPVTGQWVKFDDQTGRILDSKDAPFKGVREKK